MITVQIINDQQRFEDFDKEDPHGSDRVEKKIVRVSKFDPKICLFMFFQVCYGFDKLEAEDETSEFWNNEMVVMNERTPEKIVMSIEHYGSGIRHEITCLNLSKIYGNIPDIDREAIANL